MFNPPTFLIALENHKLSQLMKDQCLESAKKFNWDVTVWPAVDGRTITENTWKEYNLTPTLHDPTMAKLGVQGCFLSHYQLWNKCVELNQNIIILEHDAVFNESWNDIKLTTDLLKLHRVYKRERFHDIVGKWTYSAHAYYLSPDGARKLIEFSKNIEAYPADVAIADKVVNFSHMDHDMIGRNELRQSTSGDLEQHRT